MVASLSPEAEFEPLFEIGRGGAGLVQVERMTDAQGSHLVAVKRLLPLVAGDARAREMIVHEARLAALIHHPNVVQTLAFGQETEPFIAMELVWGSSLSELIAEAKSRTEMPLEPALALLVLAQVCDGLHAAHELCDPVTSQPLHLVHRDLSPHNVLLGFDGAVRLGDFGIAKALGFGTRTRTGEVKGKLAYMSPEQALCDPVDRRSDLFAVGALLFETLSGKRMLGDGSEIDVLRRLATEEPPPLTQAWPHAPPSLCYLYQSLVARNPESRPASAKQVAEAFRTLAAAIRPLEPRSQLSARMHQLFPGRLEKMRLRVEEADFKLQESRPYREELEAFVERPSRLHRERRRARTMLALGLGMLGLAVVFVIGAASRSAKTEAPPASVSSWSAQPAPVSASAEPLPSAAERPSAVPSAEALPSAASAPPRSSSKASPGSARSAPSRPPAPKRDDKLDEHPF